MLVHGLFVNADQWRYTLMGLADSGYRVYALDLLGCGWSSKPPRDSPAAQRLNGENGRFEDCAAPAWQQRDAQARGPSVLRDIQLGTASGGSRVADVDLRHPLGSPYNFYTWSEQIADFTRDIVLADSRASKATLIANSIGTISSLQCMIDAPGLFDGVCVVNPNFRELHSAEVPLSSLVMPVLRQVQKLLREKGQGLFDTLAKRDIVAQILKEPYAVESAIDDELLTVGAYARGRTCGRARMRCVCACGCWLSYTQYPVLYTLYPVPHTVDRCVCACGCQRSHRGRSCPNASTHPQTLNP